MRCAAMCSTGFDGCDFGIALLEAQGLAVITTRQYRSCGFVQPDHVIPIKEIISLEDPYSTRRHKRTTQTSFFFEIEQYIYITTSLKRHVLLGHLV
jgi:hypothetical protein